VEDKSYQVLSHQVGSCQDISVQLKLESGQVRSAHVRLGENKFRVGKMWSGRSRTCQIKPSQVRSGEVNVISSQVKSG